MDNKIDRIIKKILKEQGVDDSGTPTEYSSSSGTTLPEVTVGFDNVKTYKDPRGIGFLIPESVLVGDPIYYNKQAWTDDYTNIDKSKRKYDTILKNKDNTYKKLCYKSQLSELIQDFLMVRDKWIPSVTSIKPNQYHINETSLNDAISLINYYSKNKKTYRSKYTEDLGLPESKKQVLDGTDYFFYVLKKWIETKNPKLAEQIKWAKGDQQTREVVDLGQKRFVERWSWYIKESSWCETQGQFSKWYEIEGDFVKQLYDKSVYSFTVNRDKFSEMFAKNKGLFRTYSENIKFRACFSKTNNGIGEFKRYMADVVPPTEENYSKGIVQQCYGIEYPQAADVLGLTNNTELTQEGGWFTNKIYAPGSLIDIPLSYLNVNYQGQPYQEMVDSETNNGSLYWVAKGLGINLPADDGTSTTFHNKLEIPIETPFNEYTGNLFDEEDYVGHVKGAEDTMVYTIPQGGLSPYIPGAIKENDKYYIFFKSGEYRLKLYLPTPQWWNDFGTMVYKIKNMVSMYDELTTFSLVLSIKGPDNLVSIKETQGENGWSFKMTNNGNMFFGVKGNKVNYNNKYYYPVNDLLSPYDFNDTEQLDTRSGFGQFIESGWGIAAQVVVGIVLASVCAPAAAAWGEAIWVARAAAATATGAESSLSTVARFLMNKGIFQTTRLEVYLSILFEIDVIGVPLGLYYKSRGDDFGFTLSVLCCFLPLALSTRAFSGFTTRLWTNRVAKGLSEKIILKGSGFFTGNMTLESLTKFITELNHNEAMAFGEMLNNLKSVKGSLAQDIIGAAQTKITQLTKSSPDILEKITPTTMANITKGSITFVAAGGGIFVGIAGAQTVYSYWESLGKKITTQQAKEFVKGYKNMRDNLQTKVDSTVIEKINRDLKSSNAKLRIKPFDEWWQEFLKKDSALYYIMCEKNGWEQLLKTTDTSKNPKTGYVKYVIDQSDNNSESVTKEINEDLKKLSEKLKGIESFDSKESIVLGDKNDKNSYKLSNGLIYSKPKDGSNDWVEVSDEKLKTEIMEKYFKEPSKSSEFNDVLPLIYKQFPCLTPEKNNFEFLDGVRDPFYIVFKVLTGSYIDKEINVIYNEDTEDNNTDFAISMVDTNGSYKYFTDEIKSAYSC